MEVHSWDLKCFNFVISISCLFRHMDYFRIGPISKKKNLNITHYITDWRINTINKVGNYVLGLRQLIDWHNNVLLILEIIYSLA